MPPADLVPGLLDDPVTRAGVVGHVALTTETAQRLADDPDNRVRRELAEHPQLLPELRDQLAEDPSAYVRVGIFARPDTPEPTRQRIYDGIPADSHRLVDQSPTDLDDETAEQELMDSLASTELRHLSLTWVTANPQPFAALVAAFAGPSRPKGRYWSRSRPGGENAQPWVPLKWAAGGGDG